MNHWPIGNTGSNNSHIMLVCYSPVWQQLLSCVVPFTSLHHKMCKKMLGQNHKAEQNQHVFDSSSSNVNFAGSTYITQPRGKVALRVISKALWRYSILILAINFNNNNSKNSLCEE
jgi:hypothetical protein